MATATATRASEHYWQQKRIAVAAVVAARAAAERSLSLESLVAVVSAYQLAAATAASESLAAEAGRAPLTVAASFADVTALGFPLEAPLSVILEQLEATLDDALVEAVEDMYAQLAQFVATEVSAAGIAAGGVEIVAEPTWTNYVRVLNPPSCARCVILAGRIYRDLDGFERHPNCDCVHWPVTDWETAHDLGLVSSPQEAFELGIIGGYLKDGTWKPGLSKADMQAIEDGADIGRVINAHRGMTTANIFGETGVKVTTAGTTRRSAWRRAHPNLPYRLRPEAIYHIAGGDRGEALRLLRLYGYLP